MTATKTTTSITSKDTHKEKQVNHDFKDVLLNVALVVVLNIFEYILVLLTLQLDISKNDLRMLQKDFFVKVTL